MQLSNRLPLTPGYCEAKSVWKDENACTLRGGTDSATMTMAITPATNATLERPWRRRAGHPWAARTDFCFIGIDLLKIDEPNMARPGLRVSAASGCAGPAVKTETSPVCYGLGGRPVAAGRRGPGAQIADIRRGFQGLRANSTTRIPEKWY
jgi:hypothetical protein